MQSETISKNSAYSNTAMMNSKTNRSDGSKASVVRLFSNYHGVIFYKIISMAFICTF